MIDQHAPRRGAWLCVILLIAAALALWLPALDTPWWGDDYIFLQVARTARLANESWWVPFWPDSPFQFWRPLSQETYWRFVEGALGASGTYAHGVNITLLLLAAVATGVLGATLARTMDWPRPHLVACLSGSVYGVLAMHFLPVHFVSAANSSISIIFSASAIALWIVAPNLRIRRRLAACACIVMLDALALLSKESAVLLPLLMLCTSAFAWPRSKPGRPEFACLAGCAVLTGIWLVLRSRFALPAIPEYQIVFGSNILRNTLSMVAWLLNVPREALRMAATGNAAVGVTWAMASAIPMLAFLALACEPLRGRLTRRQLIATAAFVVLAYSPYFLLAWQCYEYYAATAAVLPALLLGFGLSRSGRALIACLLLAISSLVAVWGSRMADYPALIGRARWARSQLALLDDAQPVPQALAIRVSDWHRFSAIGAAGIAWHLRIPLSRVYLTDKCPDGIKRWLVQADDGISLRWHDCASFKNPFPSPTGEPRE